jgi:hypothetical protein
MTRKTLNVWLGVTAVFCLTACSASDGTSNGPSASATVNAKVIDADVAVSSANAIMADLDNFVTSDVFGGVAASVNVAAVSLTPSAGDNAPPPTTPPTPATGENHDGKPAGTPPVVPPTGNPCHNDSAHDAFECIFANANETSSSTVLFLDNKGTKTVGFVPGTTDTVRTTLTASKKITSADGTLTEVFYRNSQRAVGGFLDPNGTRTTNGAGTGADTSTFKSGTKSRSYAGVSADTIRALVYAEHRALNPYPRSGTMIHVVQSNATEENGDGKVVTTAIDRRVVVTYDGSALATIQVGTTTCLLHLDTRKVDGCK